MTDFAPRKGMTASQITQTVEAILAAATLPEKVTMMSGRGFFESFARTNRRWCAEPYRAGGGCERLGVPALYFSDGPRGVCAGRSTCFPVPMARGASFDVNLERRIGEAMSIELRAQGCTLTGAVCINLLRHPAWGRAQETYGEDPYLLGEMGAAFATGLQTHNVAATVKHFALNSIENARFKIDVHVDDRTLREVYLAHFRRTIDAGCATVMSAYNKVNGEYSGQNRTLLTEILRHEWGFDGFVHSDWLLGVHSPYGAAAGLDVENPEPLVFGEKLVAAVESGAVEPSVIDEACRRILRVIYRFACSEDPLPQYTADMVASPAHRALAREAAQKSAVLLKNDGVLPLSTANLKRLAVLGRLADLENTGDNGSSRVSPPYVVTPLEGLKRFARGRFEITTAEEDDLAAAGRIAAEADAVIVVAGYTADEEGEFIPGDMVLDDDSGEIDSRRGFSRGGDRTSLDLPEAQVALIETAAAATKPLVVVIVAGSAVMVEGWHTKASALLQSFYAGMEGGSALADLLFGVVSPSGKLPFTVARDARDYPFFDPEADRIEYGLYHGYTLMEREGRMPRFAFGHGLSYTRFAYRALKVRKASDRIDVEISVTNSGAIAAEEVVQFYVAPPGIAAERPRKLLKGFARVSLAAGETKAVRQSIALRDLTWWSPARRDWLLESGTHRIFAGPSSREEDLLSAALEL